MSLIANGQIPEDAGVITDPLFPSISIKQVREFLRTDSSVTDGRLKQIITEEMLDVQRILSAKLDNPVPAADKLPWYFSAVANGAGAKVCEMYRNYDSTNKGANKALELTATIDEHRRNKMWAISKLIGGTQTVVALI